MRRYIEQLRRVHSRRTELNLTGLDWSSRTGVLISRFPVELFTAAKMNWTDRHQVDPDTRRVIGHARQRHEVDWLQFVRTDSSVQLSSSAVNTALGISKSA